jgi:hypothetical protein
MSSLLRFRVAPAVEAPELLRSLSEGRRLALSRHGLSVVASDLQAEPGVVAIAAETASGQLCGGACLHRRSSDRPLPLEELVDLPEPVQARLTWLTAEGLGEVTALWVAPECKVPRLPEAIIHAAIATGLTSGIPHLVGLSGPHIVASCLRAGFQLDPSDPVIPYPTPRFRSRLVWRIGPTSHIHSQPAAEGVSP